MATYSNILAWKVLWTVEPEGLLSKGSRRVGYNWSDLACMNALEKEMATHSNILAWRIPGTQEPGGQLSVGLHRARYNWSDLAAEAASLIWLLLYHSCIITTALGKLSSFIVFPTISLTHKRTIVIKLHKYPHNVTVTSICFINTWKNGMPSGILCEE